MILSLKQQRSQINTQLNSLQKEEEELRFKCLDEIELSLKKEIQQLVDLCEFKQKFTLSVLMDAKADCKIYPFETDANGYIDVKIKEPKGYDVACFINEDSIGNVNMDAESDFKGICPSIAKQIIKKKQLEKLVKEKAIKIAKKYDLQWDDIELGFFEDILRDKIK